MASLADLMAAAEQADSDYRVAVVGAANARADYELALSKHMVACGETSVSARRQVAENNTQDERRLHLIFEAQEKAAKTHVQVLLGLLVAKQSEQKFQGKLDGGTDWGDEW